MERLGSILVAIPSGRRRSLTPSQPNESTSHLTILWTSTSQRQGYRAGGPLASASSAIRWTGTVGAYSSGTALRISQPCRECTASRCVCGVHRDHPNRKWMQCCSVGRRLLSLTSLFMRVRGRIDADLSLSPRGRFSWSFSWLREIIRNKVSMCDN